MEPSQSDEDVFSLQDAKMFPIYGSITLLSLYLLFKYYDKNVINYLFTAYFLILGILAFQKALLQISRALTGFELAGYYHLVFNFKKKSLIDLKFGHIHLVYLIFSVLFAMLYSVSKHWIISNIYAILFSISAIEILKLDSFKTGMILLAGLFFYDIFWVFGTDVMVTVAKNFDVPIKVVWPKDIFAVIENGILNQPANNQFSLLGLGDIVLPGVYIALCLRYDYFRSLKKNNWSFSKPYFKSAFIAYILGLMCTMAVMHVWKSAQPALLYLSPACILSTLICGWALKELPLVFSYSEEEKPQKKSKRKVK
jgi:minor histocompatibility antigen H13